jgi:hypothetical protein
MYRIALIACLLFSQAALAQSPVLPGFPPGVFQDTAAIEASGSGAPAYSGPGDLASGWAFWWGLRGFSAAYSTGSNPAIDICDTATGLTCTTGIKILSNGNLDVATAAAAPACAVSCSVTKWYDQTNHGYHQTQVGFGIAYAPILKFNCIGTLPCLSFTGTQFFENIANLFGGQAQPLTVSFAGEQIASGAYESVLNDDGHAVSTLFGSSSNTVADYAGSVATAPANTGAFHAVQMVMNGAASACSGTTSCIYVDGNSTAGSPGTNGWSANAAISISYNSGRYITGYLLEDGMLAAGMTTTLANQVCHQQAAYWGIAGTTC